MDFISKLALKIGEERAKQIDELGAAFLLKNSLDPSKVVLVQHTDFSTGRIYSWFERKRGRSRKEIIENLKM